MTGTLSYAERPASLLDTALPRSVERAARKIADRLNTPVHVFHILSGARKGEYDVIEATDTAWLQRYHNRSSAEERAVITPSYDVPVPLHVMRDAQRRADRKGEALHLFRVEGDYDGVFASDHTWLKQYRTEHTEVTVVEPTHKADRKPDREPAPSTQSTRPKKASSAQKTKKDRAPKQRPSKNVEHVPTTPVVAHEEVTPVETTPAETVATVTPPAEMEPRTQIPKTAAPKRAKPTRTPQPSTAKATTTEEDELASAEARMDRLTRLLETALAK